MSVDEQKQKGTEGNRLDEREGVGKASAGGRSVARLCTLGAHFDQRLFDNPPLLLDGAVLSLGFGSRLVFDGDEFLACVEVSISAPIGHDPYVCPQRARMLCPSLSVQTEAGCRDSYQAAFRLRTVSAPLQLWREVHDIR
jgi:hypothetical protein